MSPNTLIFYENQRETFEQRICEATESMVLLLTELKLQGTSGEEIIKRFVRAKRVIKISIDLEKRFKTIVSLNA